MPSARDKSNTRFPPLEYLKVVGYFRTDFEQPQCLLEGLLDVLESAFGDRAEFQKRVEAAIVCEHRPMGEMPWKYSEDVQWHRLELDTTDFRRDIQRPGIFCDGMGLVYVSATREAHRSPTYRAMDYIWTIHIGASVTYPRTQFDCMCVVGVSTSLFPEDHKGLMTRASTKFSDEIIQAFIKHGELYYSLMDANYFREDGGGWCFEESGPSNWSSVRFRIEHELWEQAREARREKVRGVYPGQYLSPIHLEKLGGKERFIADLLKMRNRPNDLITDLGDKGMILRLTPTPIDATAYGLNQGFFEIATWVFRRFRDAGLFL